MKCHLPFLQRGLSLLLTLTMILGLSPVFSVTALAADDYEGPFYDDAKLKSLTWKSADNPTEEYEFAEHNVFSYVNQWEAWNHALADRSKPLGEAVATGQIQFRFAANVTTTNLYNEKVQPAIIVWNPIKTASSTHKVTKNVSAEFYDTYTWYPADRNMHVYWTDSSIYANAGFYEKWYNKKYVLMRDTTPPRVSGVNYVEGGDQVIGKSSYVLTGGEVVVDVTFSEPIDPDSAANLKLIMGGKTVENTTLIKAMPYETKSGSNIEPSSGEHYNYTTFRYKFTVPADIQTGVFNFAYDAGTPVVDYFGGNALTGLQDAIKWYAPRMTVDTVSPRLVDVITYPATDERHFTMKEVNGSTYQKAAKTVYVGMVFANDDNPLLPAGTRLQAGIYEIAGAVDKGALKQEIELSYMSAEDLTAARREGIQLDTNNLWFQYELQESDQQGVIDLRTSSVWTDADGSQYYDLLHIFTTETGEPLDLTTLRGALSKTGKMQADSMRTNYSRQGEGSGSGTILPRHYWRDVLPELTVNVDADEYAQEHTIYIHADQEGVYDYSVTLADLLSADAQKRDDGYGKATVYAPENANLVEFFNTQGVLLGTGQGAGAVNLPEVQQPVGGVVVRMAESYQNEAEVPLIVRATDKSGAILASVEFAVKLDNKGPQLAYELGKGIEREDSPGTGDVGVFYKLYASDLNMAGGGVYYRYVQGDDPSWQDAVYVDNGDYYNAPLVITANEWYQGTLEFYAEDGLGNVSDVEVVEVSFNNLVPFDTGSIDIQTSGGYWNEHVVVIDPDIAQNDSYTIEYLWSTADSNAAPLTVNRYQPYDEQIGIGSYADQQQWRESGQFFDGSYLLTIVADDGSEERSESFTLLFLNNAPQVTVEKDGEYAFPGETITVTVNTPVLTDATYKICRPGEPGTSYQSGTLTRGDNTVTLSEALALGYYELYVEATNDIGTTTSGTPFKCLNENNLAWTFDSEVQDSQHNHIVVNQHGTDYLLLANNLDSRSVPVDLSFSFPFENGDLVDWTEGIEVDPITLELDADGVLNRNVINSTRGDTKVSYDSEAGRVIGTVAKVKAEADGEVNIWFRFQWGRQMITSEPVRIFGDLQLIEDYVAQIKVIIDDQGVQEDGSVHYDFVATDPLGLAKVTDITDIKVKTYQERSYTRRNLTEVEGPAYGTVAVSSGYIPNDPDSHYEFIRENGNYTGVRFDKNTQLDFRATLDVNGLTFANKLDFSLAEDRISTTSRANASTLVVDFDHSEEVWQNNSVVLPAGGGYEDHYPVSSARYRAGDVNYDNGNNGAGYMRPAARFYSDIYQINDFALMALTREQTQGYYGNWPDNFQQTNQHIEVTEADKQRFQEYRNTGKLTMELRPLIVTYVDDDENELFREIHESYTVTLLDNTEFRTYWLCVELDLGEGQTEWVYVADTFWPNLYMNDYAIVPYKLLADYRQVPDFTISDPSGTGEAVVGVVPLAYASVVLTGEEFFAVFPNRDRDQLASGKIYDLSAEEKQAAKEYALSLPESLFQKTLEVELTDDTEYEYYFISMDGGSVAVAKFSASDYGLSDTPQATVVTYYADYEQALTWDGTTWISLYADNETKTPADIAIAIEPGAGEVEYYYIADSSNMNALIDPASVVLEASETGGVEELDTLLAAGHTLYKNLLLRPDPQQPEAPFGAYTVTAINVKGSVSTHSVSLQHRVQATGPNITITESVVGTERYVNVQATDDKSGLQTLDVWIDGQPQTVTGSDYLGGPYATTRDTVVQAQAVNNVGIITERTVTFTPSGTPGSPPTLGTDYTVAYQYKDAQGQLRDLEDDETYSIVYAVIELLNSDTTVTNNEGALTYAFLPGSYPNFTFKLANSAGVSEQLVTNPRPLAAADLLTVGYALDEDNRSATITLTTPAADLALGNLAVTFGGASLPLAAAEEGEYTATVRQNGTYDYTVQKDGYPLLSGTVAVSGIAGETQLTVDVSYSKETPTYNNVIATFTLSQPAQAVQVDANPSSGVTQISNTQYVFSENGAVSVMFSDGAGSVTATAVVTNIDKTPPDATFSTDYMQDYAGAVVSFVQGSDSLQSLTLNSVRKLDGGFFGSGAVVGRTLDEIEVAIYQNGTYRFTVMDEAGNTQNIDVTVDRIDDTLPEITGVEWAYYSETAESTETAGSVVPTNGYVEILEKDGNKATNEDLTVTMESSKEVMETGLKNSEYKNKFVKVFPANVSANYVFEDKLGNAISLGLKIDVIDKGMPVIEFENGESLSYFELNQAAYSKDDFYQFQVGDYKDNRYTAMDKSAVSIDFGEFNPDDLSQNQFDYKNPYVVTYRVSDAAGNTLTIERMVRLFGKSDICVLVDGQLPSDGIVEVDSDNFEIRVENYSGVVFASIQAGEYNSAQMKSLGTPLTLNADQKSFTVEVPARRWYTISVRTETMESFTFKVWVN